MRKITSLFLVALIVFTLLMSIPLEINAESTKVQDGLEVTIETDRNEYSTGEEIRIFVNIQNRNFYQVKEVSVNIQLPEGFTVRNGYLSATDIEIGAGKSRTESVFVEYTKASVSKIILFVILAVVFVAIVVTIVIIVKSKRTPKALCILLCMFLVLSMLPVSASAESEYATISLDKIIIVNGKEHTLSATVKYALSNESNQVVPKEIAEFFGVDPNEYDTDKDGLGNYFEIFMSGTDPKLKDTDQNGISDADEDRDCDGISNRGEVDKGTNLLLEDTDGDGLSDYKEVYETKTDPCLFDTDKDELSDGDEIVLRLDPLVKKTDGVTLDSQRTFTQDLNPENINEYLISEKNQAVPSLSLTTNGNINSRVSMIMTDDSKFGDSRAIVGEPVDIIGDNIGSGTISFTLQGSDTSSSNTETDDYCTKLICKYLDNGQIKYLDTTYDDNKNVISADVDGEGTYYVFDVKNLFDELGIAMPKASSAKASATSAAGDSSYITYTAAVKRTSTRASYNAMAQADIVFLIDTTGSMSGEINNVKNNVEHFVDALKEKGVSAGLALIDYQDIEADGHDSTKVHKTGNSNWFYDMDAYKTAISKLKLGSGGDEPECAVDALETGRLLDMRPSAGKIFILVTDADYKVNNRYDIPSMGAEIELLKNAGITCAVVSSSSDQSKYYELYNGTNGIWANINGDFYTELMKLADKIGSDIVGDGYWIYLDGPVPVPVRLDEAPRAGSTVDTDKDGIYDIDELEGATPTGSIDLDALITKVSKGSITGTDYGTVMMYKYKSNPELADSDYDGYFDGDDEDQLNWNVSERDLAMLSRLIYCDEFRDANNFDFSRLDESTIKKVDKEFYGTASIKELIGWHLVCRLETFYDGNVGGLCYGVFVKDNNVVVAVRGTYGEFSLIDNMDWKNNILSYPFSSDPDTEMIMAKIDDIVNTYVHKNDKLYITGHSRGGMLAQRAAVGLVQNNMSDKIEQVVYFNGIAVVFAKGLWGVGKSWHDNLESISSKVKRFKIDGDVVDGISSYHVVDPFTYKVTSVAEANYDKGIFRIDAHALCNFTYHLMPERYNRIK